HPALDQFSGFVMRFIEESPLLDLVAYLAAAIVAGHSEVLIELLAGGATLPDPRGGLIRGALALRPAWCLCVSSLREHGKRLPVSRTWRAGAPCPESGGRRPSVARGRVRHRRRGRRCRLLDRPDRVRPRQPGRGGGWGSRAVAIHSRAGQLGVGGAPCPA